MNADLFDAFTRRFTLAGSRPGTRRSMLKAIGLGVGIVAIASETAAATPVQTATGQTARQVPLLDELQELVFELEGDVDRIFRFVRDEVVYDPYPGILRGARGTLWGLAGNAVDQAVLLTALLDVANVPTRFVVGELNDEAAAKLLAAGDLTPEAYRSRGVRLFVPSSREVNMAEKPLTSEDEALVGKFPELADRVAELIDRHVAEGVATVLDGLERAGVSLPAPAAQVPDAERRHVWVQFAAGPDWIDLDPSIPGAQPGDIFAADPSHLEALPSDLYHRVSFRLVAEQVSGDSVSRNELLKFEAPSADLVGVPLTLMHPQPEAMEQVGVAVSGLIQGFRNFVPTLLVGAETVFGVPVTFGTGGGVLDVFRGETVEGDTLAEWLEVTVSTPEGAKTTMRTVFDRVGEDARAAGPVDPSAVAPVDLVEAGNPESSFLPLGGLWSFCVAVGVVPEQVMARTLPDDIIVDDILSALQAYHYSREVGAWRAPALAGVRLYHNAPNVTSFVLRPTHVRDGDATAAVAIDLMHREVAVAPGTGTGNVHPLVAAGVIAHAVEQTMFEAARLEPLDLPFAALSGVNLVFAEAAAQGIDVTVLRPGDSRPPTPEIGAGAKRLVEEALDAGLLVILPERPVLLGGRERSGWWLVDPATGATRDEMDDGGGSLSENALLIIRLARCAVAFMALGFALGALAMRSMAAIEGGGSRADVFVAGLGTATAGSTAYGNCAG